jgi:adenosylmethionine-8-amino-7-oxononanoate aminotransferase
MTHLLYPTTNLAAIEQLSIVRGEGVYVYDTQGKRYLEGMSGLWCTALGYGNQELIDTVRQQMETLSFTHLFGGKTHPMAIELADRLSAMLPVPDARLFFGNSGSDANDTHVKLLRYYADVSGKPNRFKIITRERAYHGVTLAAGSLTSLPVNAAHFNPPLEALGILRTDAPHYYRGALPGEREDGFVERITNNLEQLIIEEGPETIAAFLAEPVTGASGVIVPPGGYYAKVQAILKKYGILFIADEVITGFGRTGNDFGCTTMGIEPDMMTLAKQLSSAYFPISAAAIPGWMHDALIEPSSRVGAFGHGYTYSGHPVGCAVALKTLEIFQRDRVFDNAAAVGAYLQERLEAFKEHALVGEVRGLGLIAALELVADKQSKRAFEGTAVGAFTQQACQEAGLIVRSLGNTVAVCPPLVITRSQVDELVEMLGSGLDAALGFAKSKGLLESRG